MAAGAAIKEKEEPLHLKQGSKLFSRLLTRESSAAAPSFRVYYGVASAGAVPFLWESQPGTPKNAISAAALLPPLTPPPSYYIAAKAAGAGKKPRRRPAAVLSSLLPKILLRRARSSSSGSPSSSCSSSSSSSSTSSFSLSLSFRSVRSTPACSSMRSQVHAFSVASDDDDEADGRMMPTACFNVRHESFRAFKGCRVAMTVRSALASVAGGHGGGPSSAAAQKV